MSKNDILLDIKNLKIEGFSDEKWHPIVKGVDLTLRRGQIMGLIGESGAGKVHTWPCRNGIYPTRVSDHRR
jgi:peptide/nickel transport system ATP-binding protein